jgi:hypothetical protein
MFGRRNLWIPIILAVVTVFLVIILLNGVIRPVPVVVAKAAIAPGTRLTADLVDVRSMPIQAKPQGAFGQTQDVVGKVVAVGRAPGDFITASVLGEEAQAGLPAQLEPGHVALAVRVDMASGVAGLLRPGQVVTVIGVLSPEALGNLRSVETVPLIPTLPLATLPAGTPTPTPRPTATPEPPLAPLARIAIRGLKVIMVPQGFRYEELPGGTSQDQLFASARTTMASQQGSVIVLDVPTAPVQIMPDLRVNPATLLVALDRYGTVALALEPAAGLEPGEILTLNLADLYQAMNAGR